MLDFLKCLANSRFILVSKHPEYKMRKKDIIFNMNVISAGCDTLTNSNEKAGEDKK